MIKVTKQNSYYCSFKQQDKKPLHSRIKKLSCTSLSYVNLGFPHKRMITYGDMKHEWVTHRAKQQTILFMR